jgi:hypothetical protein
MRYLDGDKSSASNHWRTRPWFRPKKPQPRSLHQGDAQGCLLMTNRWRNVDLKLAAWNAPLSPSLGGGGAVGSGMEVGTGLGSYMPGARGNRVHGWRRTPWAVPDHVESDYSACELQILFIPSIGGWWFWRTGPAMAFIGTASTGSQWSVKQCWWAVRGVWEKKWADCRELSQKRRFSPGE